MPHGHIILSARERFDPDAELGSPNLSFLNGVAKHPLFRLSPIGGQFKRSEDRFEITAFFRCAGEDGGTRQRSCGDEWPAAHAQSGDKARSGDSRLPAHTTALLRPPRFFRSKRRWHASSDQAVEEAIRERLPARTDWSEPPLGEVSLGTDILTLGKTGKAVSMSARQPTERASRRIRALSISSCGSGR